MDRRMDLYFLIFIVSEIQEVVVFLSTVVTYFMILTSELIMKYFHCQDLRLLLKRYLDPMKDENFMSQSEVCKSLNSIDHCIQNLSF